MIAVICLFLSSLSVLPGEASYLMGAESMRKAQYADAVSSFEQVVEAGGALVPWARLRIAQCRARSGSPAAAVEEIRSVTQAYREGPWVRYAFAEEGALLYTARDYAGAAQAYDVAVDVALAPSWFTRIRFAAAESRVQVPGKQIEGFDLFAELAQQARWRNERIDSAKRLAQSPYTHHLLLAAEAFVSENAADQVSPFIERVRQAGESDAEQSARCRYIDGMWCLATKKTTEGMQLLDWVVAESIPSEWGLRAGAELVRRRWTAGEAAGAPALLTLLEVHHPDTQELGAVLFWLGEYHAGQGRYAESARFYERAGTLCPSYSRATTATMRAAMQYEAAGKRDEAIVAYERLPRDFPWSIFVPEAHYKRAHLLMSSGKTDEAYGAWMDAAQSTLGNYYTHRALQRLAEAGRDNRLAGDDLSDVLGVQLVRPRRMHTVDPEAPYLTAWDDAAWLQRLRFFCENGLEEAEWEALYLVTHLRGNPLAPRILRVLAQVGLGGTAAELAETLELFKEDPANVDRLLIDYPYAYTQQVNQAGRDTGLDPLLLLAVARQESLFRAHARSTAGATGVMQLMPSTAKWLADVDSNVSHIWANHLTHPNHSLLLGAHYLRRMLRQYESNIVFALAAYNAGPGNLSRWRRNRSGSNMDDFIEHIPFSETKNYVMRVIGNYAAYRSLYDTNG